MKWKEKYYIDLYIKGKIYRTITMNNKRKALSLMDRLWRVSFYFDVQRIRLHLSKNDKLIFEYPEKEESMMMVSRLRDIMDGLDEE